MLRIRLLVLFTMVNGFCFTQSDGPHEQILRLWSEIDVNPELIIFENHLEINNEGGHLQGVQLLNQGDSTLAILSGSSSTDAYLILVDLSRSSKVQRIIRIFEKPLKHAGGFQICENYLAVGVEDNEKRNRSEVCIYDLQDLGRSIQKPVVQIRREGLFERATAGCVGMVKIPGHWMLIVGDWNTRNLDFYQSENESIESQFALIESMYLDHVNRSSWSDPEWLPYQNINLIYSQNELYLVGMTSDINKANVADLFHLSIQDSVSLTKISRLHLENQGGDFIWGGGVFKQSNELRGLIGCERNLTSQNHLYLYLKAKN